MLVNEDNCFLCDSLETFLHFFLNKNDEAAKKVGHLYFRGEGKYHKYLVPSLYLDEGLTKKSSEYYYRVLLNQIGSADYSKSSDLFRAIADFQHQGAKTRILEVSENPLIALFFACEKYSKGNLEPGYVYIFGSHHIVDRNEVVTEHFDVGHTVAAKIALNLIPQEKINEFMTICKSIYARTSRNDWKQLRFRDMNSFLVAGDEGDPNQIKIKNISSITLSSEEYTTIQTFMYLLNQRAKTNGELVYPFNIFEELMLAHIVIPSNCSDRVKMQQSAFIFPKYVFTNGKTMEDIQKEIDRSVSTLSANVITEDGKMINAIKIPGDKKVLIRKQLAQIGITEGFVYPEIEHRSNTLLSSLF